MTHAPGTLYIVSAPSGAGKTSLVKALIDQLDAALGDDAQAGALDHGVDRAGQVAAGGVRLDDREGAFGHGMTSGLGD